MDLITSSKTKSIKKVFLIAILCLAILFAISLFVGKYPLSLSKILSNDEIQLNVFINLRLSRTLLALIGGFVLAISGYVFQTVFQNPLASPDIIGIASGASAGAAAGILLFTSGLLVTVSSFCGAILSIFLVLIIASIDKNKNSYAIVLSGIAVHAIAQTILMVFKLTADPTNELASIEYWIMGGLSGMSIKTILPNLCISIICIILMCLLQRQTLLLSLEETQSMALGVNVFKMRIIILGIATLSVASIISLTGLISFVGLIAPHIARKILKDNNTRTILLTGVIGSCLLILSDILARSFSTSELPISIFTSIIGAPFLIYLVLRRSK